MRDPGVRRLAHAPRVRGRPRRRVRRADGRRAVRRGRHPVTTTPRAPRAPRSSTALAAARRTRRCGPASPTSRSSPATGSTSRPSAAAARSPRASPTTSPSSAPTSSPPATTPTTTSHSSTGDMLAACAPLARWIDVFCEEGAFDADQSRAVLEAGRAAGLGLRVHGNQLGPGPGVQLAVELGAASVDHCTYLTDDDVDALAQRRHRRHLPPRHRLLHPPALPRRPPRARRRRAASPSPPTATPARATRPRWRSASRSRCATCA